MSHAFQKLQANELYLSVQQNHWGNFYKKWGPGPSLGPLEGVCEGPKWFYSASGIENACLEPNLRIPPHL